MRTTSEGEIVTTKPTPLPTTTTPAEVCDTFMGMDDPTFVPARYIEVIPFFQNERPDEYLQLASFYPKPKADIFLFFILPLYYFLFQ